MEIRKIIKLDVIKTGNYIICKDLTTLSLVMGTKGISGNLEFFKITRVNRGFKVHINTIKERVKILEDRVKKNKDYLEIMRQVVE